MKKRGFTTQHSAGRQSQFRRLLLFFCLLLLGLIRPWCAAAAPVSIESPIGFFTNVANRLLKTQSTLELNRIQIYPTNQYTPSIHRLLQVTANVYDCMTNRPLTDYPYLPSVFRPLFANDNGVIYICGYAEETGTNLLNAPMRDLSDPADRAALQMTDMVWGVPAIIGVKKGYPGFNKFAQQIAVQATRRLQFRRPVGSTMLPVTSTNAMYMLSLSNTFGLDAWNPYSTAFPRDLRVVARPQIRMILTNEMGTVLADRQPPQEQSITNIPSNSWPGYSSAFPAYSFVVPALRTSEFLPTSSYSRLSDAFVSPTNDFETLASFFYVPAWFLTVRTRVCFAIVDPSVDRIVDYVNLAEDRTEVITDLFAHDASCPGVYAPSGAPGSMWCTNTTNLFAPNYGVMNQLVVSFGSQPWASQADWARSLNEYAIGMDKTAAIDSFRNQFGLSPMYSHPAGTVFYRSNSFAAPYQPIRTLYLTTQWQANDPLLHSILPNLTDVIFTNVAYEAVMPVTRNLGSLSARYEPWRMNRTAAYRGGIDRYETRVKDPLILAADSWNFPSNLWSDLGQIGGVHRGSPWQTLYLKSSGFPLSAWTYWNGYTGLVTNYGQIPATLLPLGGVMDSSILTMPTNDWRLCSALLSMLGSSPARALSSPNQPDANSWSGLLDGITGLTNNVPDDLVWDSPAFAAETMTSNSPQAAVIAAGIEALRVTQPSQRFASPGDIVAAPELSIASPWLNTNTIQMQEGINDEAYEAIPPQLLLKLRPDSIASVSSPGGPLRIRFTAADNGTYGVQTSTNLLDWTLVSTNVPDNGAFEFEDAGDTNSPRRFYRSILLP